MPTGVYDHSFRKGIKLSDEHREKLRHARKLHDSEHPQWRGDTVKYIALHQWVARKLGKPMMCENCGNDALQPRQYNWANVSGEYKRDISDWARLCVSCHHLIDNISNKVWAIRRKKA